MAVYLGSSTPSDFLFGSQEVARIYLGTNLVWERFVFKESTTSFSNSGTFTYTIPRGTRSLDIIGIGGGGGGDGGGLILAGGGGYGGVFDWTTVRLGTQIPSNASSLTVVVGGGGSGGSGGAVAGQGQAGANSVVWYSNTTLITASGGAGGDGTQPGKSVTGGNNADRRLILNSRVYDGASGGGLAPGGGGDGGSAGFSPASGQSGGTGRVWIRSY